MHYKQNNKESKTYVQGLRPFSKTVPRGLKGILKKNGYNYSEIISKWDLLVGSDISNYSYPKSIKMTKGNDSGILVLAVERGNEINLEYSKKDIINKINSYFGYKLISEIRLNSFNSKERKIKKINVLEKFSKNFEKKLNEVNNKRVRDSLAQLLDAIKND